MMMTNKFVIGTLSFIALTFLTSTSVEAAIISVTSGTSIQSGMGRAVSGDTIEVQAGTYTDRITVDRNNLTFRAVGEVVMKGFIIYGDNTLVEGFHVSDPGGIGILIRPESSNTMVRNNRVQRAKGESGIEIHGSYNTLDGNEIWGGIQAGSGTADADGIRFFGDHNVMKNNYVHDFTYSDPLNVDPHIDCFQTWHGGDGYHVTSTDSLIESNFCDLPESKDTNALSKCFQIDGAVNLTIKKNLCYTFMGMYENDNTSGLKIINNTFVGRESDVLANYPVGLYIQSDGITVKNNIFYDTKTHPISFRGSGLISGYNWFYRSYGTPITQSTFTYYTVQPTDKINTSIQFVNASAKNYRLPAGSPACTAGEGGTYVGAYSCSGSSVTNTPTPRPTSTPTSTPTVTPRPTSTPTPTPGYCPSDIDRNYVVGGSDVQRILTKMATTCSGCAEDINGDGNINTIDYLQVQKSWGNCSV